MQVLVVNRGSSSLRLRVIDADELVVAARDLPPLDPAGLADELASMLRACPQIAAAGHRVVHGGSLFTGPVLLGDDTDALLSSLTDLAPLHNPPALAAIEALKRLQPSLPQVACFDTTFHRTIPARAHTYAVPREWRDRWHVRRYGFHGLSHAWASRRGAALLDRPTGRLRLVTAHVGSGASLAAVDSGRSIDTTMGFTPMEGLVMASRSGTVDPGIVLWVQRHLGLSVDDVDDTLERRSGLLGLSDSSADLRVVIEAADQHDELAQLAYEVYVYRLFQSIGAMVTVLGGIDGLVFTGGAGEASARLRADVCGGLELFGVLLDQEANHDGRGDRVISAAGPDPAVMVVEAREDLEIDRHVRQLLG
jgi:acetate kinase